MANLTNEFLDMTYPDKYYKNVIEPAKMGKGPVPSKFQMLSKSQPFKAVFNIGMNPAKYGAVRSAPTVAARTAIGSNIAYGLPFAYAGMADLLQNRLEDQGLTGEGGIYDTSGGWGAEAAGADVEYDFGDVYDDDKRGTIAFDPNKINEAGMSDMYPFANIPSYLLTKMLPKGLQYLQQKFKNRQGTQKAHEELRNHIENQRAAANQVRQNIQTYGSGDRPNTGINRPGGGYGQSPTGGDVAGTPFSRGGILGAF